MTTKQVCPTCETPYDGESLEYFASRSSTAPAADDVANLYEDTFKIVNMLGALAEAAPQAVEQRAGDDGGGIVEESVMWLSWLAEELTKEAKRRLLRVQQAGL